jgi:hypothetical protein
VTKPPLFIEAPSRVVVVASERTERGREGSTEPVCEGNLSNRSIASLARTAPHLMPAEPPVD